jgi:hypothetical protein
MFEFKFQKWFNQILESFEFPTDFERSEPIWIIHINSRENNMAHYSCWATSGRPKSKIGEGDCPWRLGVNVDQFLASRQRRQVGEVT